MSQISSLGINNQPQTLSLSSIDINSVDINQPLSKSSLVGLSFNDLVDIYDKTISQYQTLYQQFMNNYNPNDATCGIQRAYYWGNQLSSGQSIPPNADFTSLAQNSFNQFLTDSKNANKLIASNSFLGYDPEVGVPKYLWIDYKNDRKQTGTVSFPENSAVSWDKILSDPVWKNSSCKNSGIKGNDGNSYGGEWQNAVYTNDGSYLGIYPDSDPRAMINYAGNRDNSNVNTVSKCQNYAIQNNQKYFGLQFFDPNRQVAECWTTNDDSPTTGYARYGGNTSLSSLQTYTKTLETIEQNLDLINSEITLYIEGQDPNFFQNLSDAQKNSLLINSQYDRLRNMRKEIVQDTFKYEPPLETSSNFVKQSNHLYILIFILLFLIIYIFTYNYYTPLKSTSAQTGGAREKNYLLLFVLFATLAIILKFLS
jgi:hypothetical protein